MEEKNTISIRAAGELMSVKRMSQFKTVLTKSLKEDVNYIDAAVFILNTENNVLQNLLKADIETNDVAFFLDEVQLQDMSISEILLTDSQDLDAFMNFPVNSDWQKSDVKKYFSRTPPIGFQLLSFPLREGNDFIGSLMMLFEDPQMIEEIETDFLKLLAININMALIQVMVDERKLDIVHKADDSFPLDLTRALAGCKNSGDLARIVKEMMLPYLNAASCIVAVKKEQETIRCVLSVSVDTEPDILYKNEVYRAGFDENDYFFNNTAQDSKLSVYDFESLNKVPHPPLYLQQEIRSGVREKLAYPIYIGRVKIGCIFINRNCIIEPGDVDYDLVSLVLSQLSTSILQMIEQEQLRNNLVRQEMLFALAVQIASAGNISELFKLTDHAIRNLIGSTHSIMTTIKGRHNVARDYSIDEYPVNWYQPENTQLSFDNQEINDGFLNEVILSDDPLVFNLQKVITVRPLPGYLKVNYDVGSRQVVMAKFRTENEIIGFWVLLFDTMQTIPAESLKAIGEIAVQLSVTLQKIIMGIELENRERERSRLMQFSNAIASVKDKNLLAGRIREYLRDLFDVEDFVLWSLTKDNLHRSPVLYGEDSIFATRPVKSPAADLFKNNDGVFDMILSGKNVSYFEADEINAAYAAHPFFSELTETSGFVGMGGSVLRVGDEIVGILTFSSHHLHLVREREDLFLEICLQLAIIASNMLATEKISEQLIEISRFKERLEDEKIYLQEELETSIDNSDMIGTSAEIKSVHTLVKQVAYTDSTVLILGETGTGKELVARSVHNGSPRGSKLMVKVNCAALPASLIESELFGHEKGSFTGASERRLGKFELANHGTLFLDEIGEIPLDLQGKLLRALQEQEIERIGGKSVIKIDVRIIAATNRNLEKEVSAGKFRSDLYYRINIFPIRLPPLRDRLSDIPLLATHFISKYAAKAGKNISSISSNVLRELQQHSWPGNIRELEHVIQRSILLAKGDTLKAIEIPVDQFHNQGGGGPFEGQIKTIDENEREYILKILKMCRGRINGLNGAAVLLGIPPSTLNSKMKRLDIRKHDI